MDCEQYPIQEDEGEFQSAEYGVVGWDEEDETHFDPRHEDGDENDNNISNGRIRFSTKKLYGRESELESLVENFSGLTDQPTSPPSNSNSTNVFFLSGYSGCGKSSLVKSAANLFLQQHQADRSTKFRFIRAKYDEQETPVPYKAISDAFRHWSTSLSPESKKNVKNIRQELERNIGDDVEVLASIIPILAKVSNSNNSDNDSFLSDSAGSVKTIDTISKSRLIFAFQSFMRLLCVEASLILFIDDMQWADQYSLDMLLSALSDSSIQRLCFVGAYRTNDFEKSGGRLHDFIERLEKKVPIKTMELMHLSKEDIGEFISDTLELERDEVLPLTEAVYARTLGNIFFTKQAIEQLVRRNALYFDMMVFRWQWVLRTDELEDLLSTDLLEMVKTKIDSLPGVLQRILIVASHIRTSFDIETLMDMLAVDKNNEATNGLSKDAVVAQLDRAAHNGLLNVIQKSREYSFAHDRIREVCRKFLEGESLFDLLFAMGNALAVRGTDHAVGEDWMLFTAVQHLNSLPGKYYDEATRLTLARFNLETARLSIEKAAFENAADFAEKGIGYLPSNRWEVHGTLCHELYALAAEASRLSGRIQEMERLCTICLTAERHRPWEVKFQMYYILANGLLYGADRYEEAKKILLNLLSHLGCKFPKSAVGATSKVIMKLIVLFLTKRSRTERQRERIDFMSDPIKIQAMKLLDRLFDVCFMTRDELLVPLVVFKALEYTLNHGLSIYSPKLTACICPIMIKAIKDVRGASMYGQFALEQMRQVNHKPIEASVMNVAYTFGLHWTTPPSQCAEALKLSYEVAMKTGSAEQAAWAIYHHFWFLFEAGTPLTIISSACATHVPAIEDMGQKYVSHFAKFSWRTLLLLMGVSRDDVAPLDLSESEMQNPLMREARHANIRIALGYIGDYEECANGAVRDGDAYLNTAPGTSIATVETFMSTLSCLAMARYHGIKSVYMEEAKRRRRWIMNWVRQGKPIFRHFGPLLRAEFAAIKGRTKLALRNYKQAAELALEAGYIHNCAVANERWALLLWETNQGEEAETRFQECLRLCSVWGAVGKIRRLKEQFSIFRPRGAID